MFVPIFRLTSQWAVTWAGYDSISAEDQRSLLPNVKKCSLLSAFGSIFGFWNTLFLLSVYVFGGMVWFLFNIFDGHEQNVQYLEVGFCCFFWRLFIWNYQSSFLFSIDTSVYGFVVRARGLGFGMLESGMIGCDSAPGSDKVFVLNTTKLFCFRNLKFARKNNLVKPGSFYFWQFGFSELSATEILNLYDSKPFDIQANGMEGFFAVVGYLFHAI